MAIGLSTLANHPNDGQFRDFKLSVLNVWTWWSSASLRLLRFLLKRQDSSLLKRQDFDPSSSGMTSSPLPVIQMTTGSCLCSARTESLNFETSRSQELRSDQQVPREREKKSTVAEARRRRPLVTTSRPLPQAVETRRLRPPGSGMPLLP